MSTRRDGVAVGWEVEKSIKVMKEPRKSSVGMSQLKLMCMMCEQYYRYCVECLWVDTTKCIISLLQNII